MENGREDLAKRRRRYNMAMEDFHRHSIKKQLCELHFGLSTIFWPMFRYLN